MKMFSLSSRPPVAGLLAAVLMLFAPTAFSSDPLRVEGTPVISTKAEAIIGWRAAPDVGNTTAITFTPLNESVLKNLQEENSDPRTKRVKIGVSRNAETEVSDAKPFALNWKNVGEGYVSRLAATSPEAKALRVALRLHALPDSAELRFSGSSTPENVVGVVSGKEANALRDDNKVYWTPVTEGETQNIEIYLPSTISTEDVKIRLNAVSHLFTSAQEGFDTVNVVKASQYCQVDVACKFSSLGAAFQNTTKAVARMVFTEAGTSYTCTGTLLNDTASSQTPYFWSAAHCISTQSTANTLNTYWFYEAASCGSAQQNSNSRQLSGGAQLLHANTAADTLFLRLNNSAPAGAYFSGWDANRFSSGSMIGIHHPSSDLKKISTGKGEGRTCDTHFVSDLDVNLSSSSLVSWSEGSTEKGSSGSGLFTLSNGSYYLRGGLWGGSSTCFSTGQSVSAGNADCYSRLDLVYNDIKQYLNPSSPTPGPTREYDGAWYNPGESGWGLTIMQVTAKNYLFVAWYSYDSSGKPTWYLFDGANWTGKDIYTAAVRRYTGPAWGNSFDPSKVKYTEVGNATLTFTSATTGKFQYNVDGVNRSVDIYRLE